MTVSSVSLFYLHPPGAVNPYPPMQIALCKALCFCPLGVALFSNSGSMNHFSCSKAILISPNEVWVYCLSKLQMTYHTELFVTSLMMLYFLSTDVITFEEYAGQAVGALTNNHSPSLNSVKHPSGIH